MQDSAKNYFAPLGELVVRFNNLELLLGGFIASLAHLDSQKGLCITAEMSFSRKLDALKSLLEFCVQDEVSRSIIEELIKKMSACEQKRNTFIHSAWIPDISNQTISRVKSSAKRKRGLQFGLHDASVEEIKLVNTELESVSGNLTRIWTDLQSANIAEGPLNKNG